MSVPSYDGQSRRMRNYDRRMTGYLIEHPQISAVVDALQQVLIDERGGGDLRLHIIGQDDLGHADSAPDAEIGDLLWATDVPIDGRNAGLIKQDGTLI
jgi:hypothetical protein